MKKRYIDAHVHITPEHSLGRKNERYKSELLPYGLLKADQDYIPTMPPYIPNSEFTADTLVHLMDVYDVDKAVIQQSLMTPQNEAVAQAVKKYPDRLTGAMIIEPTDGWQDQMDYWYDRGLHSIKFEMRAFTNPACYPDIRYNDPRMMEIFEKAQDMNMPVTIDPAPVDFPIYEPDDLSEVVQAFPKTRFIICHLGYPKPIGTKREREKWEQMTQIAEKPNCWIDVSALSDLFDEEGWPYPTALQLFCEVKEKVGIEKLIWGTDIAGALCKATYPQLMQMFERADLNELELNALFYENAERVYFQ